MAASLRVTQVKSTISHIARNRATIRALGLHRIGDIVVVPDNDATRGMVRAVRFLVSVEEVEAGGRRTTRRADKAAKVVTGRTDKTATAANAKAVNARADKAAPKPTAPKQARRAKTEPVTAAEEDK
jgi:large subunit ribosomal protein L30